MKRDQVERRLFEVHTLLVRARQELAVIEEQLDVFLETAEESRIRALVSETPLPIATGRTRSAMPRR